MNIIYKLISRISLCLLPIIGITEKATAQCTAATPSVISIIDDSVTLSWTAVTGAVGYEYAILPQTAPQPSSGIATTATMLDSGNLAYGTYKAWLRTNCGTGYSSWAPITFSITCSPPSLTITNVKDTGADISWATIGNTATYEYVLNQVAASPTIAGTATSATTLHAGSLTGGTTYYIHVRTQCNSTTLSVWNDRSFITAFPAGIVSVSGNIVLDIAPNPFTDAVTISLKENSRGLLSVTNILGATVYMHQISGGKQTINLSQQPAGLYLVRYSDNNITESAKIIKQ